MAEGETAPKPQGNSVRLSHGSTAFGLTTKELPFVLMLIIVAGMGYYRIKTHDASLQQITMAFQNVRTDLHEIRAEFQSQKTHSDQQMHQQTKELDLRFAKLENKLEVLNHNLHRPLDQQLPLHVEPKSLPQGGARRERE